MPTIITHALLPVIVVAALPRAELPGRLLMAGMIAAVLPDADVIGRFFGIPHTADFGHRGATHTLLFALLTAILAVISVPALRCGRRTTFFFILLATLSHPLTDMLTDGGKGIMLLWPLEDDRFKFWLHPIRASAIGFRGLETGTIWPTLWSEFRWLLVPACLLATSIRLLAILHPPPPPLIDSSAKRP